MSIQLKITDEKTWTTAEARQIGVELGRDYRDARTTGATFERYWAWACERFDDGPLWDAFSRSFNSASGTACR